MQDNYLTNGVYWLSSSTGQKWDTTAKNPCAIKWAKKNPASVALNIEDQLVGCADERDAKIELHPSRHFTLKDIGDAYFALEIQAKHDRDQMHSRQEHLLSAC